MEDYKLPKYQQNQDYFNPFLLVEFISNKYTFHENTFYSLQEEIRLKRKNLEGANLQGLKLLPRKSHFREGIAECIDFKNSNFHKADLTGSHWEFSCFTDSRLSEINLNDSIILTSFFSNSDFSNTTFFNSWVYHSHFYEANMRKTFIVNADFRFSSFVNADLSGASISNSNFKNTILLGTNLSNVSGMLTSNFTKAQYNSKEITEDDFWLLRGKKRERIIKAFCASKEITSMTVCIKEINTLAIEPAKHTIFSQDIDPQKLAMIDVSDLVEFARKFTINK